MLTPERIPGDYEYRWECPSCHEHFGRDAFEYDVPCPKCGGEMDGAKRFTARPITEKRHYTPPFEVIVGWEKKEAAKAPPETVDKQIKDLLDIVDNPLESLRERQTARKELVILIDGLLPPEREDYCLHDCDTGAGCSHQTREKKP